MCEQDKPVVHINFLNIPSFFCQHNCSCGKEILEWLAILVEIW